MRKFKSCLKKLFSPLPTEPEDQETSIIKAAALTLFVGILMLVFLAGIGHAQNAKTYIPVKAYDHRDTLYTEISRIIPELPDYNFVPALIEHESCISLTHSKCWSATSVLSNKREYSVGFFQIAKAYNPDGTTRMDTLASLKRTYKSALKEATWDNLIDRPDLQMRAGISLIHSNWNSFIGVKDPNERMKFVDNAYNGGAGWVNKERRACGLKAGCDDQLWYGNVETTCMRSKTKIPAYGNRSICDISRNHTRDVFETRMPKYQINYFNEDYLKGKQP